MRGVGGPLLTIGDLLSDLAVDDPLAGGGDVSVPSSPSAAQSAGEADPADLSRLFEVFGVPLLCCSRFGLHPLIYLAYAAHMFVDFRIVGIPIWNQLSSYLGLE
jgi:hypothetical protein